MNHEAFQTVGKTVVTVLSITAAAIAITNGTIALVTTIKALKAQKELES